MPGSPNTLTYDEQRDDGAPDFSAPYLALVLECSRPTVAPARYSLAEVDLVVIGRGERRSHRRHADDGISTLQIEVDDGWMSSNHVRIERDDDGWELIDAGSKNGTFVEGKRVNRARLSHGDLVATGDTLFIYNATACRSFREPPDLDLSELSGGPGPLATLGIPLSRTFEALVRIAAVDVAVLIRGDTGTGKEVIARETHRASGRRGKFIAVNCGAIAQTLVESELFGYKKGAFSGATEDRSGLVRAADGGTLFLDEVGELPEASQVKLLRVLQEREVTPVGATQAIPVDIRIIAATHKDLLAVTEQGGFRRDLFARLKGFEIVLPSLADRREDIGLLTGVLLKRIAGGSAHELALRRSTAHALFNHQWPLNIRELEQALRSALALSSSTRISLENLPKDIQSATASNTHSDRDDDELRERLARLMRQHKGNVSAVAREIGKARVQIRRWCKRFGLDPGDYRD